MTKIRLNQKGFGVISAIILLALIFAGLNAYAYYNPSFSLAKYSPLNYFALKLDEERIKDLKSLEKAVLSYYEEKSEMPGRDGWCGRMSGILHPEVATAVRGYFPNEDIPNDPTHGGDDKDYFYYRVDRAHYILMAALDVPKEDTNGKYNYTACHDWPGNDVYNYQINNLNSNWNFHTGVDILDKDGPCRLADQPP